VRRREHVITVVASLNWLLRTIRKMKGHGLLERLNQIHPTFDKKNMIIDQQNIILTLHGQKIQNGQYTFIA
jgi:hypothetical protein